MLGGVWVSRIRTSPLQHLCPGELQSCVITKGSLEGGKSSYEDKGQTNFCGNGEERLTSMLITWVGCRDREERRGRSVSCRSYSLYINCRVLRYSAAVQSFPAPSPPFSSLPGFPTGQWPVARAHFSLPYGLEAWFPWWGTCI